MKPVESEDEMICRLDRVSLRTLQNCMQTVFEDGPKRDRRLWLGDLRLQALANYETYYWGGMISHGADTFWELYNPENPAESPYGSSIVNSYCHAWSCTPTYLLRKYFN